MSIRRLKSSLFTTKQMAKMCITLKTIPFYRRGLIPIHTMGDRTLKPFRVAKIQFGTHMEPNNGSKNKTLNPHIVFSLQIPNQLPSYAIFIEKFVLHMLLLHPCPCKTIPPS